MDKKELLTEWIKYYIEKDMQYHILHKQIADSVQNVSEQQESGEVTDHDI